MWINLLQIQFQHLLSAQIFLAGMTNILFFYYAYKAAIKNRLHTINDLKDELKNKNQEYKDLDRLLAIVIHDMGNNILLQNAGIHHLNKMIEQFDENKDRIEKKIRSLGKSSRKVREHCMTVRDLKETSSLYTQKKELFPVIQSVNDTIDMLDEAIFEKRAIVKIRGNQKDSLEVYTNKSTLSQTILSNLLGNALRHSPYGSKVIIKIDSLKKGVLLSIANPIEACEKNCDLSTLISSQLTSTYGKMKGMGLGLPIAKMTAKNLGMDLELGINNVDYPRDYFEARIVIPI